MLINSTKMYTFKNITKVRNKFADLNKIVLRLFLKVLISVMSYNSMHVSHQTAL